MLRGLRRAAPQRVIHSSAALSRAVSRILSTATRLPIRLDRSSTTNSICNARSISSPSTITKKHEGTQTTYVTFGQRSNNRRILVRLFATENNKQSESLQEYDNPFFQCGPSSGAFSTATQNQSESLSPPSPPNQKENETKGPEGSASSPLSNKKLWDIFASAEMLVVFPVAVILIATGFVALYKGAESMNWPVTTNTVVLEPDPEKHPILQGKLLKKIAGVDVEADLPAFIEFEVDGKKYVNNNFSYKTWGGLFGLLSYGSAYYYRRLSQSLPPGTRQIPIHYNPKNPQDSVVEPGIGSGSIFVIGLGAAAMAIAFSWGPYGGFRNAFRVVGASLAVKLGFEYYQNKKGINDFRYQELVEMQRRERLKEIAVEKRKQHKQQAQQQQQQP